MSPRPGGTWWAVEWHSRNRLDGDRRNIQYDPMAPGWPQLFSTRAACRAFIEERYGYIRTRPDLRAEPLGWRMPQAVMVRVVKVSPDRRHLEDMPDA